MNLSGPLLLLFLTAACTVSGEVEVDAVIQFGNMIECVQPVACFIKYINYGCYCGLGGQGTPVDELDQCCKVHDDCYGACMRNPDCKGWFPAYLKPYLWKYDYTCTEDSVTCSATNNKCQAAICECDRAAALCFAQAKYNPKNAFMDQAICKK